MDEYRDAIASCCRQLRLSANLVDNAMSQSGESHQEYLYNLLSEEIRYRTAALINQLSEAQENGNLSSLHKKLSRADILILDEFGYVPYNRTGSQLLFDYLSEIHEKKVIILNTNLEFSRWVNVLYDEQMTADLVGRLMHHCHLILFPGEHNRLRESSINDLFSAQRGGGQNG